MLSAHTQQKQPQRNNAMLNVSAAIVLLARKPVPASTSQTQHRQLQLT
jgi:hypothetical protein